MIHQHLPNDARIVDEVFNVIAKPGLEKVGWLLAMIAVYGKMPAELEGFTWNEDNSINIRSKKRPIHPLHPQWVFIFQLKEKQPLKKKSCWNPLVVSLTDAMNKEQINLSIDCLILAHKIRKIYYTPIKRQKQLPALVSA